MKLAPVLFVAAVFGCGGTSADPDSAPGGDGSAPGGDGSVVPNVDGSSETDGGVTPGVDSEVPPGTDGGPRVDSGPGVDVTPSAGNATGVDVDTALPEVGGFASFRAWTDSDTLRVVPFPVEGARDYRVYPLPDDANVHDLGSGRVAVQDGTYRCAGQRYAPSVVTDRSANFDQGQTIVNGDVDGYSRSEDDSLLGYIALEPAEGLSPLYALGSPDADDDNTCFEAHNERFAASRPKRYTASESDRTALMAEGWRDDGIVGYVPQSGAQVFRNNWLYYVDGAERSRRGDGEAAFALFADQMPGTEPLKRVYYGYIPCGGGNHDELTVGEVAFEIARQQGVAPSNRVSWAGVETGEIYVVEALSDLCPYQGTIVSMQDAAGSSEGVVRRTIGQIRSDEQYAELYINGQGSESNRPRVLARAFIRVDEIDNSISNFEWNARFQDTSLLDGISQTRNDYLYHEWANDDVMLSFIIMDWYSFGVEHDELWVAFDEANGSNGKMRISPQRTVALNNSSFVHATMSVDSFSSPRRYPQLWVTDQRVDLPIQELSGQNLENGGGILLQSFGNWPVQAQIELCNQRGWDVNNQCPVYDLRTVRAGGQERFLPHPEWYEEFNLGWRIRYDFYVSTDRAYAFLNQRPFACVDIPSGALQAGDGHVTFGAVLYHSGALPDVNTTGFNEFHDEHLVHGTRRFFDDLAVDDGSPAPTWDESIFPCVGSLSD